MPFAWSGHMVHGINYAGTQIMQRDFQNKGTVTSPAQLPFVLKVTLHYLCPSIIIILFCTMWPDHAKGLLSPKAQNIKVKFKGKYQTICHFFAHVFVLKMKKLIRKQNNDTITNWRSNHIFPVYENYKVCQNPLEDEFIFGITVWRISLCNTDIFFLRLWTF